jgi:hypothetical protein
MKIKVEKININEKELFVKEVVLVESKSHLVKERKVN